MATMRAVVMEKKGPAAEALVLHTDWPVPVCKPNQVLIEGAATCVNAGEWKVRSGFAPIPKKTPKILGEDVAGLVAEAPEGSKFKKGDRVFANTGQALKSGDQGGTYGEFVAADEGTLCFIPPGISFLDAAAVPMAGLTAWQALEPAMPLQGKRVLVHGGAGGVGGFAIQIAKAQGAHVTTTCSTRNVEYVTKELGADEAIDYTAGPWEAAPTAAGALFDAIVDTVGGPYQAASLRLLAPGGWFSALGATGPDVNVMLECQAARGLEQLAELMAQGKLKVHLDRVLSLEEMVAAHEYAELGHVRGKVGITIKKLE
ncbi:hypothetical protein ABPG75_001361 [Micractinium tetrahymenae]